MFLKVSNGRFSCFVVGSGVVALRCTELLRLAGHQILGVYSFDAVLTGLEDTHGIPHAVDKKQFEKIFTSNRMTTYLVLITPG